MASKLQSFLDSGKSYAKRIADALPGRQSMDTLSSAQKLKKLKMDNKDYLADLKKKGDFTDDELKDAGIGGIDSKNFDSKQWDEAIDKKVRKQLEAEELDPESGEYERRLEKETESLKKQVYPELEETELSKLSGDTITKLKKDKEIMSAESKERFEELEAMDTTVRNTKKEIAQLDEDIKEIEATMNGGRLDGEYAGLNKEQLDELVKNKRLEKIDKSRQLRLYKPKRDDMLVNVLEDEATESRQFNRVMNAWNKIPAPAQRTIMYTALGGIAYGGLTYLDNEIEKAKERERLCNAMCLPQDIDEYDVAKATRNTATIKEAKDKLIYKSKKFLEDKAEEQGLGDPGIPDDQPFCSSGPGKPEGCKAFCKGKCKRSSPFKFPGLKILTAATEAAVDAGLDITKDVIDKGKNVGGELFGELFEGIGGMILTVLAILIPIMLIA